MPQKQWSPKLVTRIPVGPLGGDRKQPHGWGVALAESEGHDEGGGRGRRGGRVCREQSNPGLGGRHEVGLRASLYSTACVGFGGPWMGFGCKPAEWRCGLGQVTLPR